jgi:hypothetical protein
MKAISLWQPWASLWLTDRKIHETRHWPTKHRGWLAVHAAKHRDADCDDFAKQLRLSPDQLPYGLIIGAVDLVSCRFRNDPDVKPAHYEDELCGNWTPGRFAWKRGAVVKLNEPIPYRGCQRIFTLPDEIVQLILPSQVKDPAQRSLSV